MSETDQRCGMRDEFKNGKSRCIKNENMLQIEILLKSGKQNVKDVSKLDLHLQRNTCPTSQEFYLPTNYNDLKQTIHCVNKLQIRGGIMKKGILKKH